MEIIDKYKKDEALRTKLDALWKEGETYRDKFSTNWKNNIDTVRGKTWPTKRPSYKINAVINFLGQVVEKKAALLTDSRPTIAIASRRTTDDPVCDILQKVCEGVFEEVALEQRLTELVFLEQHFGITFTKTPWERHLDFGRGDIDITIVDPRQFIFDPFIKRSYNLPNGEYCCYETIQPLDLLADKYPKYRDKMQPNYSKRVVGGSSIIAKIRSAWGFDNKDAPTASVIPRAIVRDWWIRDRRMAGEVRAYPSTWRHVVDAGQCFVMDDDNPYIDGVLPYDGMDWRFNIDSPYGVDEIEDLQMPQVMGNKLLATILENTILMQNAIWIGDYNALSEKEWDRLSNEPGQHVKTKPGTTLRREAPPALPTTSMDAFRMIAGAIEQLSGLTEVTQGKKPGQVTSGVAIEALQLAATTSIRLKARQLEYLLARIGQKMISRIFQYYTTDRVFAKVGGDERKIKEYLFQRQKLQEAVEHSGGKMTTAFQDYRFKIVPSSSLAMTKWQKGLVATQLFQLGAIDREALLDAIEFPDREAILKRTIQKQQSGEEPVRSGKQGKLPKAMNRPHKETGQGQPIG